MIDLKYRSVAGALSRARVFCASVKRFLLFALIVVSWQTRASSKEIEQPQSESLDGGIYYENCGANALITTLQLLKLPIPSVAIVSASFAGPRLSRAVSLGEIKKCLVESGAAVFPVKDFTAQNVFSATRLGFVVIFCRKPIAGEDIGHFLVAAAPELSGGKIVMYDYPRRKAEIENSLFETRYGSDCSGTCLLVFDPHLGDPNIALVQLTRSDVVHGPEKKEDQMESAESRLREKNSTEDPNKEADLKGASLEIPKIVSLNQFKQGDPILTATVHLKNNGSRKLEIKRLVGECSCFLGPKGAFTIEPNGFLDLTINFHSTQFDQTSGTTIAIQSDDEMLPLARFAVVTNVSKMQSGLILSPSVLVVPKEITDFVERRIYLFIPTSLSDWKIVGVEYDQKIFRVAVLKEEEAYAVNKSWRCIPILISLKRPVGSDGEQFISILTNQPGIKEIVRVVAKANL